MTPAKHLSVIVIGRTPEKMHAAITVLESHGYAPTGVFSEQEAARAVAEHDELFAVVAGGSIDEPAQERLRAAAASKGAVLVTAYIGNDDPTAHFTNHVIPKLADARDRPPDDS
jgi:hypothetical protein